MTKPLPTLLLTALPASGKSEVRRYLEHLSPEEVTRDFHLGETVQLDDYPYVHAMRRISEELVSRGRDGIFFTSQLEPFKEPLDWGTLMHLLNEDYRDLHEPPKIEVDSAANWLFDRLDRCRSAVGAPAELGALEPGLRKELSEALEDEARSLLNDKLAGIPEDLRGKTIVIEFARGGADGSSMPLPAPFGYAFGFAQLSDEILKDASVLYIWVSPEESRRKNEERAKPGRSGDASILNHGVPIKVMLGDYGCDDIEWLLEQSDRRDTVRIETRGRVFHLPLARFDNREDLTTFVRKDPQQWTKEEVSALHSGLKDAFEHLLRARRESPEA